MESSARVPRSRTPVEAKSPPDETYESQSSFPFYGKTCLSRRRFAPEAKVRMPASRAIVALETMKAGDSRSKTSREHWGMGNDEAEIRALIERWAKAVHAGDLDSVLADHAEDLVMFDVPPPNEVRGKAAYRDTWPPFFTWQKQGARFDMVSLEVTAGHEVAFAHALLRCGTVEELRKDPDNRLRLTIGLRKIKGRWTVTHEHHSFPLAP